MNLVLVCREGAVSHAGHADAVEPQEGAVEDDVGLDSDNVDAFASVGTIATRRSRGPAQEAVVRARTDGEPTGQVRRSRPLRRWAPLGAPVA